MTEPPAPAGPPPSDLDLPALVERLERSLLGGPREFTRGEVAAAAGLPPDETRELWRALGFAAAADDDRAFTGADVTALRTVHELTATMALDAELVRAMTRMLGRSFSRLASWQGQLVVEQLARRPHLLDSPDEVVAFLDGTLRAVQDLQAYVWRRQLAAYLARVTAEARAAPGEQTRSAVGFADMAQFTAFTRRASEAELRAVLERFESVATDAVSGHRGQLVKTIGDEVLFVADDAHDAAEIALDLLAATAAGDLLPPLRVGLAAGPVVSRLGDVFGQTVNIASRLTSLARPDSVLVDEGMQQALAGDDRYALRSLRPAAVRGYGHLRSWRLRRAT